MRQDPATAERKPDTGPLPPLTPAPLDERRARRPSPWRWAILAVFLALITGAFVLLTRPPDPMQDQRPVEVVRGFVAAIEAKDATKMLAHLEPTVFKRELGPEIRAYLEYVESVSFENARYELLDNDGDLAHVRWTATMRYRVNLGDEVKAGDRAIDTTFELTKIEGAWYLRRVNLPQT